MITTLLTLLTLMFSGITTNSSETLDDLRWKNRIVLVSQGEDPIQFSRQMKELVTNEESLIDRHMLIFKVEGDQLIEAGNDAKIEIDSRTAKKYQLREGVFEVILIGKDGGVKLRENSLVEQEKIFALIDTMPMRQAEMRRQ